MIRRIIHIDESKCNGCGACANACHEGAIGMVNGKAKLLRDDSVIACPHALPVLSPLLKEKRLNMTEKQLKKI